MPISVDNLNTSKSTYSLVSGVFQNQSCVSTGELACNHGVNGYETQVDYFVAEYGHGMDIARAKCFEGLSNVPTKLLTQICGPDIWYPDYNKGFIKGICINTHPAPNGIIMFTHQQACCQNGESPIKNGMLFTVSVSL